MITCLPVKFVNEELLLLDQRALPHKEITITCSSPKEVHDAILDMVVRGAPCIGFSGIFGLALAVKEASSNFAITPTKNELKESANFLKAARPTAVNLAYEIDSALALLDGIEDSRKMFEVLVEFGNKQILLSETNNRKMASFAIAELDKKLGKKTYRILTHCNTGFLACGSIGTALGVVQVLGESDRVEMVYVDETRPYLQGSRLTAFELSKLNIPHKVVVEGAASYLMKQGLIDAIFVGADRIVSNGDTANKVGTSSLSIIAKHYDVPFYVAAPMSTFDFELKSGKEIEIELRPEEEVVSLKEVRIAPEGTGALNPSFDVTDSEFISAIISERGVAKAPYTKDLERFVEK